MRVRDESEALLLCNEEEQTDELRSNVLVGRPVSPDSLSELAGKEGITAALEGPARVFILVGAGTLCGLLLLGLGAYGIYTRETDLLRDLVWPISMCGGAVVLWASGARGLRAIKGLGRNLRDKSEKDES